MRHRGEITRVRVYGWVRVRVSKDLGLGLVGLRLVRLAGLGIGLHGTVVGFAIAELCYSGLSLYWA